jgi:peroxiredoxin/protein-disulfide isomerase
VTPKGLLQPGILAPDFCLPAANLDRPVTLAEHRGKMVLLLFLPEALTEELGAQLMQFQQRTGQRAMSPAVAIGISDAPREGLRIFAAQQGVEFALASDTDPGRPVGSRYGVRSEDGTVLPTAILIDEEGLIRRAYDPDLSGHLPNPAAVERALNKLGDTAKPAPITHEDWRLGPGEALVTLMEYSDYECPHCAEAYRLVRDVVATYGSDVLLVHRHYLLRRTHPHAQSAAEAAEAAGAQGKFWEMHAQLFEADLGLEREHLLIRAQAIGLDVPRFVQDLDFRRFEEVVNEKFQSAVRDKVKFPPALFINRIPVEGARAKAEICGRIDRLLACKPRDAPAG